MKLTGRIRARAGLFGKLVLQVECIEQYADLAIPLRPGLDRMRERAIWRDAVITDLPELPALTDRVQNGE